VDEDQHGRAGRRESAQHHGQPRRQRGSGQQHRAEKQERKRIFEPTGEEQEDRQFRDIEGEQPGGTVGLHPLGHAEAQPQSHIEPGGERDDGQAGPDRQLEIEPEIDHQHGRGLADHGEPAQPHQRVEAHIAPRMESLNASLLRHGTNLAARSARSTAPAAPSPVNRRGRRACAGRRAGSHLAGLSGIRVESCPSNPPSRSINW